MKKKKKYLKNEGKKKRADSDNGNNSLITQNTVHYWLDVPKLPCQHSDAMLCRNGHLTAEKKINKSKMQPGGKKKPK